MKIQNAFRLGLFGGLGVLVALAIGAGIQSLATILTYIGAALFLALGIDPAVTWLEKRGLPRWLAILLVLLGVLGLFAGLVLAIIPVIADQVNTLIKQVPRLIDAVFNTNEVRDYVEAAVPWLQYDDVVKAITDFFGDPNNITGLTNNVLQGAISVATGAFGGVIVLILTLYFVSSLASIKRGLYQLVPATRREKFTDIAEQISDSVGRYVIGQVSLALVNGVLSFVFLTFIVRAEYSALLAFIAFLFSLVPLVGTISGSVLITLAVLLFNGWPSVLAVGIYYLVYMQVEAYVLSPNIMNRAVKVPGVVVVIAALAGGTLLGILGALVAIPTAAAILLIVKQVVIPRQNEL
ncbi:AI-2E family transporter [Homoserinibacter sp. YIM 151385]|uniref:AI-2E family transporter n=1 Tax=Homoserinibacter sp. YIM 151385 TaxID=2985506 RepID=UPI0022F0FA19|nr:AI-2E family transporter [Homoserinibacter sp. YIM 151385]WBU39153.1 AI-2E family transporter [Homoserinibacter sp. YIM 151385]